MPSSIAELNRKRSQAELRKSQEEFAAARGREEHSEHAAPEHEAPTAEPIPEGQLGLIETPQEREQRLHGSPLAALGIGGVKGAVNTVLAPANYLGAALAPIGAMYGYGNPMEGLTGGAYVAGTGLASRERQEQLEKLNPIASKAGDVLGSAAVGMAAAPAVGALANAAKPFGHAAHLAAEIGTGALEAGGLGASAANEEAWIKNEKLTAEHTFATIANFALWGAGATAVFKAPALYRLFKGEGHELATLGEHGAGHAAEKAAEHEAQATRIGEGAFSEAPVANEGGAIEVMARKAGRREQAADFMYDVSAKTKVRDVTGGYLQNLKKLTVDGSIPTEEQILKAGRMWNEMGIEGSLEGKLARANELVETFGPRMRQIAERLDREAPPLNMSPTLERAKGLIKTLEEHATTANEDAGARFLSKQVDRMVAESEAGGVSYSRLLDFKQGIGKVAGFGKEAARPAQEAMRQLYYITRTELENAISVGAQSVDPKLARDFIHSNELYRFARIAQEDLERQSGGNATKMLFGLPEIMSGVGGAAALGGPGALASAVGMKVLRSRGWSAASKAANAIGDVLSRGPARNALDLSMAPTAEAYAAGTALHTMVANGEMRIKKAITGLLSADEEAVVASKLKGITKIIPELPKEQIIEQMQRKTGEQLRDVYVQHYGQLRELADSPEASQERIKHAVGTRLPEVAPSLHTAIIIQAGKVVQFLQEKNPGAPQANALTPHVKPTVPLADSEIYKYAQYVQGATDPLSILDDIQRGRVSSEKIEAVAKLHPELLESIKRNTMAALQARTTPVPYETALLFDRLFDAHGAIAPDMKPESLAAMQEAASYVMQQQQARHPSPSAANPMGKSMQPRSEALAMR